MFEAIRITWDLMGASWEVLKKDKELLLFPLLSGLCCLLVVASFALPMWNADFLQPPPQEAPTSQHVTYYLLVFAFYFCNYFVIVFFNAAFIACAVMRIRGQDPTLADGFRASFSRIHLIAWWALLAATVGLLLRMLENRRGVGRFIAGLLGTAWTMATFLVVPVLVVENKDPISAVKESIKRLRQTWGQQLVGNVSFGILFVLLGIPAWLLIGLGVASGSGVVAALCIALGVAYVILLALVQSALTAIFQAAIYVYTADKQSIEAFDPDLLAMAMGAR